ncbi:hypothetical protein [Halobacillus andaensis]|uniref:hypothetical protein n=1 Tax=Halobacillus andaensis TaxID=1176239 RepID=UPI003D71130F
MNIYNGVAKGLRVNRIVYDSLNIQNGERIDVEKAPTLWMFSIDWMDPNVQQKLIDYLEGGGKLVLFPTIPTKDLLGRECTLLKDYIGVSSKGRKDGFAKVGKIDSVQTKYMERFEVEEGAFAWSEDELQEVTAFEKKLGRGKVVVFGIGMELDFDYKYEVIRELAERTGVVSEFAVEQELDVSVREISEQSYFVFLHNLDEYEKETAIQRNNEFLFGGNAVSVPGRSGLMLPVNIPLTDEVKIAYATAEVFDLTESPEALDVKVKLKQAEDWIVFETFKWRPVETTGVKVSEEKDGRLKVHLLPTLEKEVTIEFVKSS